MKVNIKKFGFALVCASLLASAAAPATAHVSTVSATSKSQTVKINGVKMTIKEFERRLNKAKVVYYASNEEIDKALKQGGRVSKVKTVKKIKGSKKAPKASASGAGVAAPVLALAAIPEVGTAVLITGGIILVGCTAIATGTRLYSKIKDKFNNAKPHKSHARRSTHDKHTGKRSGGYEKKKGGGKHGRGKKWKINK